VKGGPQATKVACSLKEPATKKQTKKQKANRLNLSQKKKERAVTVGGVSRGGGIGSILTRRRHRIKIRGATGHRHLRGGGFI